MKGAQVKAVSGSMCKTCKDVKVFWKHAVIYLNKLPFGVTRSQHLTSLTKIISKKKFLFFDTRLWAGREVAENNEF